jgi:hypothetical protein
MLLKLRNCVDYVGRSARAYLVCSGNQREGGVLIFVARSFGEICNRIRIAILVPGEVIATRFSIIW